MIKHPFILLTLAVLPCCAFAQTDDEAFLAKIGKTFETLGPVPAKDFVPADSLSGPLHTVRANAVNDGLHNTYYVDTPSGVLEVTGTTALLSRIREIYAIEYLRGISKGEEFTKAIGAAGKAKIESAANLVRDPLGTIKNVPKGASRFFGRIGEGMKGKSDSQDGALAGITGVSDAKVKLAAQLGVSPYTTNEELQRELTSVARAMAGGGLIVNAAASVASGGAGAALTVVGANETLQDTLTNTTPEDLRILNRKKLFALGIDRALADEFLMHPWYSPWHETIIADALTQIGVNPSAYLTDAVRALTPEDAFFFQRLAQILARYHKDVAPLRALRFDGSIVTALDKDGTLVIPVSLDYGIWAERTARRAEEFAAIDKASEEIKGLTVWTDGRLSDRLCDELKKRGIGFRMDALVGAVSK